MPPPGAATFMAAWIWTGPDEAALADVVARERSLLDDWARQGILRFRAIAVDETRGWLVLRAPDAGAALALLDSLPLRRWLDFEVTPLAQT